MAEAYAEAWQQLREAMPSVSEQKLRAGVLRCSHYSRGEVKTLRGAENEVMRELSLRNINPGSMGVWLGEQHPTSYSRQYSEKRFEQRFRKVLELKSSIKALLPCASDEQLHHSLKRIWWYSYKKIKNLSSDEFLIRDYLLRTGMCASTAYRWFREAVLPEDIRSRLLEGNVSSREAARLSRNRDRQFKVSLGWKLVEQGRRLVAEVL